jgi:hypothetical protein
MVETLKANVDAEKSRIISFIGRTGPIVANTIAKSLNLNSFLTSALLSELVNNNQLNSSFIRVGGSPLYYLGGQEEQLERFTGFLGHKEKEAYELLKREGVLSDKLLHPAIRVAIRDVKDFAVPLSVNKGGEEILFWKFRFFKDSDAKIRDMLKDVKEEKALVKEEQLEMLIGKASGTTRANALRGKAKKFVNIGIEKVLEKWAAENNIAITELLGAKGKDAKAKIKVKTDIGEIDFLLVLKNKKTISEPDLAWAYQEGVNMKMPVVFLSPGKVNNQIQIYLEGLGKGIILRKL